MAVKEPSFATSCLVYYDGISSEQTTVQYTASGSTLASTGIILFRDLHLSLGTCTCSSRCRSRLPSLISRISQWGSQLHRERETRTVKIQCGVTCSCGPSYFGGSRLKGLKSRTNQALLQQTEQIAQRRQLPPSPGEL